MQFSRPWETWKDLVTYSECPLWRYLCLVRKRQEAYFEETGVLVLPPPSLN